MMMSLCFGLADLWSVCWVKASIIAMLPADYIVEGKNEQVEFGGEINRGEEFIE